MTIKRALIVGIALVVLLAGVPVAVRFLEGPPRDDAIALVPADAGMYANVFLEAPGDQGDALEALLEKFPKVESPEEAQRDLFNLFDEELDQLNLTFEDDIQPWLGHQVAFYAAAENIATTPDLAFLVAVEDQSAAERAIEQADEADDADPPESRSYKGVDYDVYEDETEGDPFVVGFVRRFLLLATENGFKDVVDTSMSTDNLAASELYRETFEVLTDEHIASVYIDTAAFIEALTESGEVPPAQTAFFEDFAGTGVPTASVLSLTSDSIAIESSSEASPLFAFATFGLTSAGSDLVGDVPSTSWAAVGLPDLGETFSSFIDLFGQIGLPGASRDVIAREFKRETGLDLDADLLSWMGDAALYVQGDSVPALGGGLVLETSDPATTRATLSKIAVLLAKEGVIAQEESRGGYEGFSVSAGLPQPIYALVKDRLIVTYGENAADDLIDGGDLLSDAPSFAAAQAELGEGYTPALYVDAGAAISLAEFAAAASGSLTEEYTEDVKPWLDPISFVISGARKDGNRLIQKLVVGIGEGSVS